MSKIFLPSVFLFMLIGLGYALPARSSENGPGFETIGQTPNVRAMAAQSG